MKEVEDELEDMAEELKGNPNEVRTFGGVEIVRRESETRGEIETREAEGAVVCGSKNGHGGVVGNSDKGRKGPNDESEEGCGPDDEGKGERKAFWMCAASGRERGTICDDSAGFSTVADSSEARRGILIGTIKGRRSKVGVIDRAGLK